jgi:hypothetical protein
MLIEGGEDLDQDYRPYFQRDNVELMSHQSLTKNELPTGFNSKGNYQGNTIL